MDGRGFLGRLIAGAAAVVGAGMVAPKTKAADVSVDGVRGEPCCPECDPDYLDLTSDSPLTPRGEEIYASGYNRGHDIAEARAESRVALGLPIRRGETG